VLDGEEGALWCPTRSPSPASGEGGFETIAPLDHHRALVEKLLQAKVYQLRSDLETIEIDVSDLHAARINAHQLESGARDMCRGPCASGDAPHEGRLAGAKVALEKK
jgi:hypothetical protein